MSMRDFKNLNWEQANSISQEVGDAFYLLDEAQFINNYKALLSAFNYFYNNTHIGYSYKTNYTPILCRHINDLGGFAEVVSEMEYDLTQMLGIEGDRIIFNGPYKSPKAFNAALLGGSIVNLDSMRDLKMLSELAHSHSDEVFEVGLRCNFPLEDNQYSRFGFDIEGVFFKEAISIISGLDNVSLAGLHCHFPDRNVKSFNKRIAAMLALSDQLFPSAPPKYLNVGGGYYGEMPQSMLDAFKIEPVGFEEYAEAIAKPMHEHFSKQKTPPKLILEPGTALVANSVKFISKVIDIKQVRDKKFATMSGSIFNVSPVARNLNLPVRNINPREKNSGKDEKFQVVGYTCIEGDYLKRDYVAQLEVGDFLEFSNVGSYSIVMKPPFILPNVPIVSLADDSGEIKLIKKAETSHYIFENFT